MASSGGKTLQLSELPFCDKVYAFEHDAKRYQMHKERIIKAAPEKMKEKITCLN